MNFKAITLSTVKLLLWLISCNNGIGRYHNVLDFKDSIHNKIIDKLNVYALFQENNCYCNSNATLPEYYKICEIHRNESLLNSNTIQPSFL